MRFFIVTLLLALVICVLLMCVAYHENRIERLEKIVGTEAPASMTWTNGHIYSTIVKHSHNCGCVKK